MNLGPGIRRDGRGLGVGPPFRFARALAAGGTCEGAPGPRPQYGGPNYYLAYVRDPVGNKLSAFCKTIGPTLSGS